MSKQCKNISFRSGFILAFIPGLMLFANQPGKSEPVAERKIRIRLNGMAVQNDVVDRLEQLGLKVAIKEAGKRRIIIQSVQAGSSSYYQGVMSGDSILDIDDLGGFVSITIDRNGKRYRAKMKSPPGSPCSLQALSEFLGFVKSGERMYGQSNTMSAATTVREQTSKTDVSSKAGSQPVTDLKISPFDLALQKEQSAHYAEAIKLFKLLAAKDKSFDSCTCASCLFHAGDCYASLTDYKSAADYYQQSLSVYEQLLSSNLKLRDLRNCITQYSEVLKLLGKKTEADRLLEKWRDRQWKED